jgi:hypothetical protein
MYMYSDAPNTSRNLIHPELLSPQTTRKMYNEVQDSTKTQSETQDLSVLNERFAVANNYLTLLKNIRIQQVSGALYQYFAAWVLDYLKKT